MNYRYVANKYVGKVHFGIGFFNTIEKCMEFAKDGFCTRLVVADRCTGKKQSIKL